MGNVVRQARRAAGLSQKELARLAGISRATLNYLENEPDSDMGAIKLLHVLDVLGVRLVLEQPASSADAAAVAAAIGALPRAERIPVPVLVESLITGRQPIGHEAALARFLDQAPMAAVVAAVRLAAAHDGMAPKAAWKHAVLLAAAAGCTRTEWARLG